MNLGLWLSRYSTHSALILSILLTEIRLYLPFNSFSVLAVEKLSHNMMLPSPCFTEDIALQPYPQILLLPVRWSSHLSMDSDDTLRGTGTMLYYVHTEHAPQIIVSFPAYHAVCCVISHVWSILLVYRFCLCPFSGFSPKVGLFQLSWF